MHQKARVRPTLGFLSTWSVYKGTAIDSYSLTLLQGICAAAREHDCNLLLGCGISLPASPCASRTAWTVPGAGVNFVPVGPWNTDGLIVIPDDLSDSQSEYVQDLIRSGYPVVLTIAEKPGPHVGGFHRDVGHAIDLNAGRDLYPEGSIAHDGQEAPCGGADEGRELRLQAVKKSV
jgi:hypothetical protein